MLRLDVQVNTREHAFQAKFTQTTSEHSFKLRTQAPTHAQWKTEEKTGNILIVPLEPHPSNCHKHIKSLSSEEEPVVVSVVVVLVAVPTPVVPFAAPRSMITWNPASGRYSVNPLSL